MEEKPEIMIRKPDYAANEMASANGLLDSKELERPSASSPEDAITHLSGLKFILVVLALLLSMLLVALDMSIIATAIPRITNEFGSLDQVGWYGSAFFICLAAFVSFWGKAYRYLPIKWAFLCAILVFEVGSLVCAISPNSTTIIIGRAIQGVGGAGVMDGFYTIIALTVKPERVPTCMGLAGAVFSIASVGGPVLGGVLTEKLSWRWCFYINLPIGGAAMLVLLFIYQTPPHVKPVHIETTQLLLMLDFPGIIILIGSLVCLILALEWGGITKPWSSSGVIGTLLGFIALFIIWCIIEWIQQERALVVPRILKQKSLAVCAAFIFCTNVSGFARIYNLPIYFQAIDGVSPSESGIRVLPTVLSICPFIFFGSYAAGRIGYYQPFLIVGGMLATIGAGLIYTFDLDTPPSEIIGYQIIAGVGIGLGLQIPIIVAQATSSVADVSVAMSTILFFQFMGGGIGVSIAQNIFTNLLIQSIPIYVPDITTEQILQIGAYDLGGVLNDSQLSGVLESYLIGLRAAWAFSIAFSGITFLLGLLVGWKSLKLQNEDAKSSVNETNLAV